MMKKAMTLAIIMVIGNMIQAVEVKMSDKTLNSGAKSVKCSLITNNVNYQLAFKTTTKDEKLYISGIGLLGGIKYYSKRGWWSGEGRGFFQLKVWGKSIFSFPVTYKTNNEGIIFTFKRGDDTAQVIFKARENEKKLTFDIVLSKPIETGILYLSCYPGDFMLKNLAKRNRYAITSKRELQWSKPPKMVALDKDECWIYYEDKNFDTSKSSSYSTCAILFNPDEVTKSHVQVESDVVRTKLILSPKKDKFNFTLWEFPGRKNEKCLELMKSLKAK